MGMFDYISARCPGCGSVIEEQSKAGPCELKQFTLLNAPASVLEAMTREPWYCNHCDSYWTLKVQIISKAWLEESINEDEEDDYAKALCNIRSKPYS